MLANLWCWCVFCGFGGVGGWLWSGDGEMAEEVMMILIHE